MKIKLIFQTKNSVELNDKKTLLNTDGLSTVDPIKV